MSNVHICDMDGYMTDQYSVDRYWHCSEPAVDYCCDSHYCQGCLDIHQENEPHPCGYCNSTGVVVNNYGLINVGQACVMCEGDI